MFLLVCILLYPFVVIFYCCLQLNCLQLVCNFLQSPPIFQFVLVCFHLQLFFIIHCSQNDCFHLLLICSFKVIFHLFPFVVPLSIIEQSSKLWNSYLQLLCLCLQFYYQNVQLVVLLSVQEGPGISIPKIRQIIKQINWRNSKNGIRVKP